MNRQQRRAALAAARKQPVDRATLVHEAGHAVGRVLTAESLGYKDDKAIDRIEIYPTTVEAHARSVDGKATLLSQGITYGPLFSRELMDFFRSHKLGEIAWSEQIEIMKKAREAGLDVDGWFRAKVFSTVLGPLAEAKLLNKPFDELWNSYSCENDVKETVREGHLCGMDVLQINEVVAQVKVEAEREIQRSEVWNAILGLADELKRGSLDGRSAAAIINRSLAQPQANRK